MLCHSALISFLSNRDQEILLIITNPNERSARDPTFSSAFLFIDLTLSVIFSKILYMYVCWRTEGIKTIVGIYHMSVLWDRIIWVGSLSGLLEGCHCLLYFETNLGVLFTSPLTHIAFKLFRIVY